MKKLILLASLVLITGVSMGNTINQDQDRVLQNMGYSSYKERNVEEPDALPEEEKVASEDYKSCLENTTRLSCSLIGPTGYITIPTQKLGDVNSGNVGMHMFYPSNQGEEKLAKYMKFNYTIHERLEISASKVYTALSGMSDLDPYFSLKFSAFPEWSVGALFDASSLNDDIRYKNSYYVLWGRDYDRYTFTFGGGINSGKKNAFSHFGDTDTRDSKKGFVLAGASFILTERMDLLMDYNGDAFSMGMRYAYDDLTFDLLMVQDGDNLAVLPAADNQKTVLGMSLNF